MVQQDKFFAEKHGETALWRIVLSVHSNVYLVLPTIYQYPSLRLTQCTDRLEIQSWLSDLEIHRVTQDPALEIFACVESYLFDTLVFVDGGWKTCFGTLPPNIRNSSASVQLFVDINWRRETEWKMYRSTFMLEFSYYLLLAWWTCVETPYPSS